MTNGTQRPKYSQSWVRGYNDAERDRQNHSPHPAGRASRDWNDPQYREGYTQSLTDMDERGY